MRAHSARELLALGAGIVVFAYLGWDSALWDARLQLGLHLVVIGAAAGLGFAAFRGVPMPRTSLEVPLLAVLAAYAAATASAINVGMSLRAMGSVVAFAVVLPLALVAVRHRPSWVGVMTALPILAGSTVTLAALGLRRIEWVVVGAPGLPPLRLPSEGSVFGSVAVPPFLVWPAWALAGLIDDPAIRRPLRIGLVAVGVPLTLLSGSRSAWVAVAATAILAGAPWLWRRRGRLLESGRSTPHVVAVTAASLAVIALTAALVVPRLGAVSSLLYRVSLWRDTLQAWSTDPILGIGPGMMPYARQAAAADYTFPVRQPHSHNIPLGVLGDAGIVGLAAAAMLVVAIGLLAGPWRSRTPTGRAAAFMLIGLGVGGLSEDLTFLPNFNILAICLLAVALIDADAVRWRPIRRESLRVAIAGAGAGVIGLVLLAAMVTANAGAVAHRAGVDAAAHGRWDEAADWLERAATVDPWHPGPPKALAIAADAAGRADLARRAAEAAVVRNPGDGQAWTNLALVCAGGGDARCQREATERAVATAAFLEFELINAARSFQSLGDLDEADDAYRRSLLSQRLTALATDWPRSLTIGDAELDEDLGALFELNRTLARWEMDEPVRPDAIADPAVRALAHAIRGEEEEADAWLESAIDNDPANTLAWDLAVVLRDHWGRSVDRELRIAAVVRGGQLPPRTAVPRSPTLLSDIASFRAYPADGLVLGAERLAMRVPFPWALQQTLP
ncbi:MAG TPA: O-antigen ligase family protein [Candidatus Limnocylindria bacterium]